MTGLHGISKGIEIILNQLPKGGKNNYNEQQQVGTK